MIAANRTLIGQRIRRLEDERFMTGSGRFVDDLQPEGLVHGVVLRSPHARARITGLETHDARSMPGVRLVLTAAELRKSGLSVVPLDFPPPGHSFAHWIAPSQPILASGEVRFVGDAIAFVVADMVMQARDAAEAIAVSFEDLEPALAARKAEPIFSYREGDATAIAQALAAADQVVRIELVNNRIDAAPIETRGCVASYGPDGFTLHVSTQRVQIIQRALADHVFRIPRQRMRVIAPDTGGGFGQKNGLYPEYVLCLEAARQLGFPVKWIADRSEAFASDCHGRDNIFVAEAGIDRHGRILAVRAERLMNMGAYTSARAGLHHACPSGVFVELGRASLDGTLLSNALVTVSEVGLGLVFGSSFGFVLGIILAEFPMASAASRPFLVASQVTPKTALAPLFIIWFGFGLSSKVFIVALMVFFPILVGTMAGIASADADRINLMRVYRVSRWRMLRFVKLPGALPHVLSGLEVASVLAVMGAVIGEFVGSNQGLGRLILSAGEQLDLNLVFSAILVLILLGATLQSLVGAARSRLLFWLGR